jgi:hypothetical protein
MTKSSAIIKTRKDLDSAFKVDIFIIEKIITDF